MTLVDPKDHILKLSFHYLYFWLKYSFEEVCPGRSVGRRWSVGWFFMDIKISPGLINSVICEQTFSYTNHYSNLKVMNGPRYNFFWIYILDLHNNYVEDPKVLKLNPMSPVRMERIFENALKNIKLS